MKSPKTFLLLCVIVVAIAGAAAQTTFHKERHLTFEGLPLSIDAGTHGGAEISLPLNVGAQDFRLYLRIKDLHANPHAKYEWTDADGSSHKTRMPGLTICVAGIDISLRPDVETDVDEAEHGAVDINVNGTRKGRLRKGIRHGADNAVDISRKGNILRLRIGYEEFKEAVEIPIGETGIDTLSLMLDPGGAIELLRADLTLGSYADHRIDLSRDIEAIEVDIAESRHIRDGYWRIVARSLDDRLLRMGGDYTLAMTTDADGTISLWYYDGATINPGSWEPGRLKCQLIPRTSAVYDVVWIDPDGYPISHDITAWFDERTGALTINFPYQSASTITLQKSR